MKKISKTEPPPPVRVHALSSGVITVLPSESLKDLEQLIEELNEQNEPKTGAERFLVDQMVHARWKLARFHRLEAVAYEHIVSGQPASDDRIIRTLSNPGNVVEKLERLIAAAGRAYSKAVRDLNRLRGRAQKPKKQNEAKSAADWLHAELANMQNEPNGGIPPGLMNLQNEPNSGVTLPELQNEPNLGIALPKIQNEPNLDLAPWFDAESPLAATDSTPVDGPDQS